MAHLRLLTLIVLGCGLSGLALATSAPPSSATAPSKAVVASVYDGDTMTLDTGDKVRVSGVNTPELKPLEAYGPQARDATAEFVLGKEISLLYGEVNRDGYGRLLAWVRVDGKPLELELLERGLGHVFLIPPVEIGDVGEMLATQGRARAAKQGIWSTENYQGSLHITSFHANAPGDDRENVNGEYLRVCNVLTEPVNLDGYRMNNTSGRSFPLPAVIVPPGYTFKVISGKGEHVSDTQQQLEVYLGSDSPIWNNSKDRATIYDRYGKVVDARDHEVQSATD